MKKIMILLFMIIGILPQAMGKFQLPSYESFVLDNGLQVYLMEQNEVPLIYGKLVIHGGSTYDVIPGVANLTAESLKFGSANLSKAEIDEKIEFLGASFSAQVSKDFTTLNFSFLKENTKTLFPLFRNFVLKPKFDSKEFKKYKKLLAVQLEQMKESPKVVVQNASTKHFYGKHGYGNPRIGTVKSIKKISLSDVKGFYEKHYIPNNAALIIVGDINVKEWKSRIKRSFMTWKKGPNLKTPVKPSIEFKKSKVLLVDKKDSKETTFYIGQKGIDLSNEDRVAIAVVNTVLGGRFTSWLNDELRVNSGLTYGARSIFDAHRLGGVFYISSFTKTETTFKAIDLALKTYYRLWESGIDKKTLDSAKAYVKGQFPPKFETSGQLAGFIGQMWGAGVSQDYINKFREKVDALDVKKVKAIIDRYYHKNHLQFVMVGKADKIKEEAKKYGEVSVVSMDEF